MKRCIYFFIIALTFLSYPLHAAASSNDKKTFEKLFTDWSTAFNRKNLAASCALFAKSVTADYKGAPRKNYTSICDGFKRVFNDTSKTYTYHYKLRHVYRSGNLAAVRITWYLEVAEAGKPTSNTTDQGIDVLRPNQNGQWQIINYLAYEE